ncbi:hypothetical protein [Halomarina rubra]|uniref:ABC transporter permease n=1 Tax=Halomarina rubra TaxID=2071873 RepID=A0ABD6B2K8_9EURY|nr:hypothetical protein [Halomarina rubra]
MTREYTTEERRVRETDPESHPTQEPTRRSTSARVASWFGEALVRAVVAVLGLVLLLFAVGRIVDVNLLDAAIDVLDSGVGAWLVLAFVGLLLVVAAARDWESRRV